MATKGPSTNPSGTDSADKPRNWLEDFKFEFQPLAESEFQRDTNVGINSAPKAIKKVGENLVVIRWTGLNTIYDPKGKVIVSVPMVEAGGVFLDPKWEDTIKRIMEEIHVEATQDIQYRQNRWGNRGSRHSFSSIAENIVGRANLRSFLTMLVDAGMDGTKMTTVYTEKADQLENDFKNKFNFFDSSKIPDLEAYTKAVGEIGKSYFFSPTIKPKLGLPNFNNFFHYTFEDAATSIGYDAAQNKMFALDYKKPAAESLELRELKLEKLPTLGSVTGIGIDHGQNFLFIGMGNSVLVYDFHNNDNSKPLKLVSKYEDPKIRFEGQILGQPDGTVLVGDSKGSLRKIQTNLHTLNNYPERQREEREVGRLAALKVVKPGAGGNGGAPKAAPGVASSVIDKLPAHLVETSKRYLTELTPDIESAKNVDEIKAIQKTIDRLKQEVMGIVQNHKTVEQIFSPIMAKLAEKEVIIWKDYFNQRLAYYSGLRPSIKGLPPARLATESRYIEADRKHMGSYKKSVPANGLQVLDEVQTEIHEVLQKSEDGLIQHIETKYREVDAKLNSMTKRTEFDDWLELDYPVFLDVIRTQMSIAPASHANFRKKCAEIMTQVETLRRTQKRKWDTQLDEIRRKASEKIESMVDFAKNRVGEFIEQLREKVNGKEFADVDAAKRWIEQAKTYETAIKGIEALDADAKDKAVDLRQTLKSEIAALVYGVRRQKDVGVDKEGRQVTPFGKTSFPIWERKIEQTSKRSVNVEVIYKVDEKTKGPGMNPDDYQCELFYRITGSDGKVEERPLAKDDMKRFGYDDDRFFDTASKGSYFPSYMTVRNAKKAINAIKIMGRSGDPLVAKDGDHEIKKKYADLRGRIKALSSWMIEQQRQGKKLEDLPESVRKQKADLTKEYIAFLHESGLYVWQKLRSVKNTIEVEDKEKGEELSGVARQGRVPDWEKHWVMDEDAEKVLEEFAEKALISLEGKEGLLSLEGHAGTGKDVIVDMFCEKTRRPKFTFDASKWTTEFDLSQDVTLSAEGGASFTVKEDSIVVKAMETPGAVLYFNEFNAMPETAQMFLHSLFDGKRQITLKTSSGRIVKAASEFLAVASMNIGEGYQGTNKPQPATRSRMLQTHVDYPAFKKVDASGKVSYAGSEALRASRSIRSLVDFTWDPDMKENEFMKLWNKYINEGQSDPSLTPERKYDMEVLFAILTFGNNLRQGFINKKKGAAKGVFTVDQPFTLRDLRRCAIALGRIDVKEKSNVDTAEETAKNLIRRFYVPLLYSEKETDDVEKNLKNWTVTKP